MTNDVVAEMIAVIRAEEERRRKARRHDVNERFAYVAGSRMREGVDVYTDIPNSWHHLSSASSTRPQRYTTGASALARSSL